MPIVTTPTLIPLTGFGLIQASGADRLSYLQGQLTCDLPKLADDAWTWAGHCDPKGKLIAAFRLCHFQDSLLMLMPQSLLDLDLPALNKYAVFNQVELVDAGDRFQLFGLLGGVDALPGEGALRSFDGGLALVEGDTALVVLETGNTLPDTLATLPRGEMAQYIAAELAAGRPWFEGEHSLEFVPQMLNLDAIGGIQYDKGCYIGQETVARMHFRGGNKRALYTLVVDGIPAEDAELQLQVGDNWRRAGALVHRAHWDGTTYLTAVMSKDLEPDTAFRFGDAAATLLERPYPLFGQA